MATYAEQSDESENVWRERAVYALLFLLPVAGISVRHWFSATFLFLTLLSLPELWRRPWHLERNEKVFLSILGGFFALFLLTGLVNGWTKVQTGDLGREVRYLAIIPIYLLFRRLPDAGLWLVRGGVVGGFALLAQALFDVYVLHLSRAQGIYSPNLLGPFAAFQCAFVLALWRPNQAWRAVSVFSAAAAVAALALSTSRGGYVGFLGMTIVWVALRFRGRQLGMAMGAVAGVLLLAFAVSTHVRNGVDEAVTETVKYFHTEDIVHQQGHLSSVPARLEMWRVSGMIFRDHPIFGVGRGNYQQAARRYVEQGRVHFEVAEHGHPHDAYLEALVSKGIFGLADFLAMLLFPLYLFARGYGRSPETATLGILHITGFALFSLTDASTIIKGNYIAIWLVYLAAFFAWHIRALRVRPA